MNILVTGGLGLIGHNVVQRLQDQGHTVSIIDTKTNYGIIPQDQLDYLMYNRLKKIDEYRCSIYTYDVSEKDIDGVFQIEETVLGVVNSTGLGPVSTDGVSPKIQFRVAQSNHKDGPYNAPTATFRENPYTNTPLSSSYSSTSNILNIDTFSLANGPQGEFNGWIEPGMVLVGKTSGARATITNNRLFVTMHKL